MNPGMIRDWVWLAIELGIPVAGTIWAVWFSKKTMREKINDTAPIIWNVVQQALRKGGGKLANGKSPIDYGLELFEHYVPINSQTKAWIIMALKAVHEEKGAPDPVKVGKIREAVEDEAAKVTEVLKR